MEVQLRRGNLKIPGKTIFLFDIDGTLTPARQEIRTNMIDFLQKLSKHFHIGAVGGSDSIKLKEQLKEAYPLFNYIFTENGLVGFKNTNLFHEKKICEFLGEEKLKKLINFCLRYIADLDIPIKRGTFIEYRTGLINVSPIGRNCSQKERNEFDAYNKENKILENFKSAVEKEFSGYNMKFSIGGQISFDCFPIGWDKTYCLQFLEEYENIFFLGDKTNEGGNDYEIFIDERITSAFTVKNPEESIDNMKKILRDKFLIDNLE